MKVFFDTNVYVAEALLGSAASQMLDATVAASWRIFVSHYVLDESERVLGEYLHFPKRLARLLRQRCIRRSQLVPDRPTQHSVPHDPADSPILAASLQAGADYLVTNDEHLLAMHPYHGLRIVSMAEYYRLLENDGLLP